MCGARHASGQVTESVCLGSMEVARNAPLQGRLTLSDGKEAYEALSYAGEPGERQFSHRYILCRLNLHPSNKTKPRSSFAATTFSRQVPTLWIGSICINQGDLSEKDFHVQRMGSIFNTASNVRIWLGMADDQSSQDFEITRQAHEIDINSREADFRELLDALIDLLRR